MVDCEHCGESFADETAYLEHLGEAHYDDLGRIDRRRVDAHRDDGGGLSRGTLAIGALVVFVLAVLAFVTLFMNDGGGGATTFNGIPVEQTPGQLGALHEHGTMTMTVDGEEVDFSRQRYQLQADPFHFESNNGEVWHTHAPGVTLQYAMATLGIAVNESSITYQGTTYVDGENAEVSVTVNGEPVDPATYVLQGTESTTGGGDQVHIEVTTT